MNVENLEQCMELLVKIYCWNVKPEEKNYKSRISFIKHQTIEEFDVYINGSKYASGSSIEDAINNAFVKTISQTKDKHSHAIKCICLAKSALMNTTSIEVKNIVEEILKNHKNV